MFGFYSNLHVFATDLIFKITKSGCNFKNVPTQNFKTTCKQNLTCICISICQRQWGILSTQEKLNCSIVLIELLEMNVCIQAQQEQRQLFLCRILSTHKKWKLMTCPFTSPKMFCAGPNILC